VKIGYIGLGAMGKPLALRLVDKYELHVWDLNPKACAEAQRCGAHVAPSVRELAVCCDVILLCLPRSENVRQAVLGPDGLVHGLAAGKVIIDQTSGVPAETRSIAAQLAQRGVAMLDAPVAGGVPAAQAGRITIMVSGEQDAFERTSAILRTISPNVFYCGERVGDGQAIKLLNNVMNAACRISTLEAVAFGTKLGLSLETLATVLNNSSARSRITQSVLPALVESKLATDFALSLMVKDVRQATELGLQTGVPMPLSGIALGLLQIGVNTLGAEARLEDVPRFILSMAGVQLTDEKLRQAREASPDASLDADTLSIGYVGLGSLQVAMVRRIMLFREIHVFGSDPELVSELEAEGAIATPDLRSLLTECDVIIIGADSAAVFAGMLANKDVWERPGQRCRMVVDQTDGEPFAANSESEELRALGVTLVDAPVSADMEEVIAGGASIFCGGPQRACALVRPVLELISSNVVYCGSIGSGRLANIVQSVLYACNRLIAYEAVAVGVSLGLKVADIAKVINHGSGWSYAFERILDTLASNGRCTALRLGDVASKLVLASRYAANCGAPLVMANAVRNTFQAVCNELNYDDNLDAMARCVETRAKVQFGIH
jgi:3-hydroxyisobutyrate dehydrogenase